MIYLNAKLKINWRFVCFSDYWDPVDFKTYLGVHHDKLLYFKKISNFHLLCSTLYEPNFWGLIHFTLVALIYCLDFMSFCPLICTVLLCKFLFLFNSILSLNHFLCTVLISLSFSGWKDDVLLFLLLGLSYFYKTNKIFPSFSPNHSFISVTYQLPKLASGIPSMPFPLSSFCCSKFRFSSPEPWLLWWSDMPAWSTLSQLQSIDYKLPDGIRQVCWTT